MRRLGRRHARGPARRRLLTVDETIALLRPNADALHASHAHGRLHRDVKP